MTNQLLEWYKTNKRDLPWRKTLDPYKIWVSEIILQQTQIKTGIKYYDKFIAKFPNIETLSIAEEIEILKGKVNPKRIKNIFLILLKILLINL